MIIRLSPAPTWNKTNFVPAADQRPVEVETLAATFIHVRMM